MTISRTQSGRAFSLVEAVMATLIVGIMVVAALRTVGVAVSNRRSVLLVRQGESLARRLMSEIMQQTFVDPCETVKTGLEASESSATRQGWDDIDDYIGFKETGPKDRSGKAIAGASGWTWQSDVSDVTSSASLLGLVGVSSTSGVELRKIVVTVTSPGGKATKLEAYRCAHGLFDGVQDAGTTQIYGFAVSMQVGADSIVIASGTEHPNLCGQ